VSAVQEPPATGTPPTDYPDRGSQLFYELAKDRLSMQLEFIDAVDNKLGLLFSGSSALMGILVAIFAIRGVSIPFGVGEFLIISISGALYIVGGWITYDAYRPRQWHLGPKLSQVWADLRAEAIDEDQVRWRVARSFWRNYEDNLERQAEKAKRLPLLVFVVILQVAALCSALGLVAAGG
jgi:hypothetical protein